MSQRQCLPIDDLDDSDTDSEINFDLSQISAHKYLKSVRIERDRCQETISVTIPKDYEQKPEVHIPVKRELQTKEWQEHQKELFEKLQQRICEIRSSSHEDKILESLPMDIEDEDECIKYCQQNEPLMSIIFTLDSHHQVENFIELLAEYFTENLDDFKSKNINEMVNDLGWFGRWTYSLIACLRIPLSPEAHSSIRTIAKNCIALIDHYQELDHSIFNALPLNLLITIIVNNFHQHDLLSL